MIGSHLLDVLNFTTNYIGRIDLYCYYLTFNSFRPCGKESTEVWITQKIGKRENSPENKGISRQKAHTNTRKLN